MERTVDPMRLALLNLWLVWPLATTLTFYSSSFRTSVKQIDTYMIPPITASVLFSTQPTLTLTGSALSGTSPTQCTMSRVPAAWDLTQTQR